MKPNEDYAGLIARLRKVEPDLPGDRTRWHRNPDGPESADALEALLAERKNLTAAVLLSERQNEILTGDMDRLRAERDALAARLAPVEDEALVEIAARTIVKENVYKETQIPSKTLARAAIAAIRPHIEAAERERCAKIVELDCDRHSTYAIAAAIRSGK